MDLEGLGRTLLTIGLSLAAIGMVLVVAARTGLPLGRLPGDLSYKGKRFSV